MNKTRSDARWLWLDTHQLVALENWLFIENISYADAQKRLKQDFGFTTSLTSLKRFYRRILKLRHTRELKRADLEARCLLHASGAGDHLRDASLTLLTHQFYEKMREGEEFDTPTLAKMLLQLEGIKLQRDKLQQAQKRWEFDAVKAARKASPLLEDVMRRLEKENPKPTYEQWSREIRTRLFGSAPTRVAPLPAEPQAEIQVKAPLKPDGPLRIVPPTAPKPPPQTVAPPPAPVPAEEPAPKDPKASAPATDIPSSPPAPNPLDLPIHERPGYIPPRPPSQDECGVEYKNGRMIVYG